MTNDEHAEVLKATHELAGTLLARLDNNKSEEETAEAVVVIAGKPHQITISASTKLKPVVAPVVEAAVEPPPVEKPLPAETPFLAPHEPIEVPEEPDAPLKHKMPHKHKGHK